MDGFASLRSGQKQMSDELLKSYKRLTDPDEIEMAKIEREREEFSAEIEQDAGLGAEDL